MRFDLNKSLVIGFLVFALFINIKSQVKDGLHIFNKKEVGQIEVGSHYVGIEIHKSIPTLNRISFYYPTANSIDISEDYWKRENYRITSFGFKAGDLPKHLLENETFNVDQTPYSVSFNKNIDESEVKISYHFLNNESAFAITYEVKNSSKKEKEYELYTKLEMILRTSHTYNTIRKAYTEYDAANECFNYFYDTVETKYTKLSVINTGLKPSSFTTKCLNNSESKSLDNLWLTSGKKLSNELINKGNNSRPVSAFTFNKKLKPGETVKVVQVISSNNINSADKSQYLKNNYTKEINEYEKYIEQNADSKNLIKTDDEILDFTSKWANAVLATTQHYIDGSIEPMPCPAEYNFYFTHDVLLTDLARVNFDLAKVKDDLSFIIKHANKDNVIPHAYFWKDSAYATEYAGPENWNNFWFMLVASRYLRHSNDIEFAEKIFPYVKRGFETVMQNRGKDGLFWSTQPDWWDIGHNFGPRAYMTILGIKALREFNYFCSEIGKDENYISMNNKLADSLHSDLISKLWDEDQNSLISYYNDGTKDKHIYMGSMLAVHFDELDFDKENKLLQTANQNLLDENLGVYTLYPMDLKTLSDFMGFVNNEAGEPYHYANGGIWPHGNSWYSLVLIKTGHNEEALDFIKRTMTIDGIMNSPNGQPAMYEYRISDKNNPAIYGKIDKPQFMWAAGWYFYSLYNLFGIRENNWNISFDPFKPDNINELKIPLEVKGNLLNVNITGKGKYISKILYDGIELPSAVIPTGANVKGKIDIKLGEINSPYIKSANAKIISAEYNKTEKTLQFSTDSFTGNHTDLEIISPYKINSIKINGTLLNDSNAKFEDNVYSFKIENTAVNKIDIYEIKFE